MPACNRVIETETEKETANGQQKEGMMLEVAACICIGGHTLFPTVFADQYRALFHQ